MRQIWISIFFIGGILGFTISSYGGQTRVVWSAIQDTGFDLFESKLVDGNWSTPTRIVSGREDDITPALTEDHDGNVWLVWIAVDDIGRSYTRYQVRKSGGALSHGNVPSEFDHNYSPSVLVDRDNTIWASWSSFNGKNEEIYVTRFNGKNWLQASRVSNGDNRPNIKPLLALGVDGSVQIFWLRLDDDGYQLHQAIWHGSHFENLTTLKDTPTRAIANKQLCNSLPPLPEQAQKSIMAAVFQATIEGIQSVPEWVSPCISEEQP
jgi:hypothetical protein